MLNLNDLFSASLTAAIAQMVTDEVTKATAPLMERIEKLEFNIAEMDKTLGRVDSEDLNFNEAVGAVIKAYDFNEIINENVKLEKAVESVLDTYEFSGRNFSEAVKDAMLDAIRG